MTAAEMPVSSFRFDSAAHRYFMEPSGEEIPGVTRALEESKLVDWSMVPPHILAQAQERGTRVHDALHFLDDGELDLASLERALAGYVEAYEKFKRDTRFTPTLVEKFVFSPLYRWAGRLDRVGYFENKHGGHDDAVVDFKSGLVVPAHRIQLVAYASGLPEPRKYRRMTLQLEREGRFRVHEYDQQSYGNDLNTFHAAVALWHWKKAYGIEPA